MGLLVDVSAFLLFPTNKPSGIGHPVHFSLDRVVVYNIIFDVSYSQSSMFRRLDENSLNERVTNAILAHSNLGLSPVVVDTHRQLDRTVNKLAQRSEVVTFCFLLPRREQISVIVGTFLALNKSSVVISWGSFTLI